MICELKNIHPNIIYIDAHQKNLGSFLSFITSGKLPALIYGNEEPYHVFDDVEEIVEFLDKTFPDPPLKSLSKSALSKYIWCNVFSSTRQVAVGLPVLEVSRAGLDS